MELVYPHKTQFAISVLTKLADELEAVDFAAWFALASAAACLQRLLQGEAPSDIAEVSDRLRALELLNPGARRCGRNLYAAVALASAFIDGHRLGLLVVLPETPRPPRRPLVWIGFDMGAGDRSAWRHA